MFYLLSRFLLYFFREYTLLKLEEVQRFSMFLGAKGVFRYELKNPHTLEIFNNLKKNRNPFL